MRRARRRNSLIGQNASPISYGGLQRFLDDVLPVGESSPVFIIFAMVFKKAAWGAL